MLAPDLSDRYAAATLTAAIDEIRGLAIAPHARDRIIALLDGVREHYCPSSTKPQPADRAIEQQEHASGGVIPFGPRRSRA